LADMMPCRSTLTGSISGGSAMRMRPRCMARSTSSSRSRSSTSP
jgi:hypothetical protein